MKLPHPTVNGKIVGPTMHIYSIFQSVDGEVNHRGTGAMTTFIRTSGCSATCAYCDTRYAKDRDSGSDWEIQEIIKEVTFTGCPNITITGGEPFEQSTELIELLGALDDAGFSSVSIETNGYHPFNKQDYPFNTASFVVDLKLFGYVLLSNYINMNLDSTDFIKIVIGSFDDFHTAIKNKLYLQQNKVRANFAFSPMAGSDVTPDKLLIWMKEFHQFDAYLNTQLHKVLSLTEAN